jgi:uncharacterized membrane protein YdcZ (DUF606 family)
MLIAAAVFIAGTWVLLPVIGIIAVPLVLAVAHLPSALIVGNFGPGAVQSRPNEKMELLNRV